MSALRQAAREHIDAIAKDFPVTRRQRVLSVLLEFARKEMSRPARQQLLKKLLRKLSPDEINIFRECLRRLAGYSVTYSGRFFGNREGW
jgi:DNA-binding MarR family transcriptional regulator